MGSEMCIRDRLDSRSSNICQSTESSPIASIAVGAALGGGRSLDGAGSLDGGGSLGLANSTATATSVGAALVAVGLVG